MNIQPNLSPEVAAKRQAAKRQEMVFLRDEIDFLERAIREPSSVAHFLVFAHDIPERLQRSQTRLERLERYCGLAPRELPARPSQEPEAKPSGIYSLRAEQLYMLCELARLLKDV